MIDMINKLDCKFKLLLLKKKKKILRKRSCETQQHQLSFLSQTLRVDYVNQKEITLDRLRFEIETTSKLPLAFYY